MHIKSMLAHRAQARLWGIYEENMSLRKLVTPRLRRAAQQKPLNPSTG